MDNPPDFIHPFSVNFEDFEDGLSVSSVHHSGEDMLFCEFMTFRFLLPLWFRWVPYNFNSVAVILDYGYVTEL